MLNKLKKYFFSGLVVFLPAALTVYFFILTINWADSLLGKFIQPYFHEKFGFYVRGLSILIGVFFIIVIGFMATNLLGKKIHAFFERLLLRLPFFRQVYPTIKEMALLLFSQKKLAFKQVVIVEYPRKGIYSIGFLTSETSSRITDHVEKDLCNVLMPSPPNPFTGYVVIVPRKEIIFTDLTMEEAVKFVVSFGVVNPLPNKG